ncbi:MAG TPA: tripartite tricarboxylate transporter substrate binding protein [Burkholderiales bacterium]|nr:tripartite tricarboxylate transporter substrate binding protein [Burkholderiales bacterium]
MKRFLFVILLLPAVALAQTYPARPVRMIIPFAPGGASDFVGRIMQPRLGELLGQPIVVDNRAGASGNIGVEVSAKSPPDGYTLFLGNIGTIAVNPAVFTKLPVNPLTDLMAVTQVVDVPSVLVAHSGFAPNSVKELVAYAKANPGKLNYGSPGSGSANRLEMELLRIAEGLDMVHVPYKGGAGPAVAGLMGGETHVMFTTAASAIGQVRGGKLKLLAVTSVKRMEQAPSAPTMVESGYPDFVTGSWQGIFVPAGTPRDVVDKLFKAIQQTMAAPEVGERLKNGGAEVVTSRSPAAFAEFVAAETRRWAQVVKDSGATVD